MNVGSILIAASASLRASGKASSLVLIVSQRLIIQRHLSDCYSLGTSSVVERSRVVGLSFDSLSVGFDGSSEISSLSSATLQKIHVP
jgi:hypothetical protein